MELDFIPLVVRRAFPSRFTLREEGQVETLAERGLNELSADVILPAADRRCQYYFC
jgi:hypothetical protein